jgi:hypothetical protein
MFLLPSLSFLFFYFLFYLLRGKQPWEVEGRRWFRQKTERKKIKEGREGGKEGGKSEKIIIKRKKRQARGPSGCYLLSFHLYSTLLNPYKDEARIFSNFWRYFSAAPDMRQEMKTKQNIISLTTRGCSADWTEHWIHKEDTGSQNFMLNIELL